MSLLRPMAAADVEAVRQLHAAVLPVQYPPAFFLQLRIMAQRLCLVAADPAHPAVPVAFLSAAIHPDKIEILTLGVSPPYQKRGLASLLIYQLVSLNTRPGGIPPPLCAHVSTTNHRAIAFYKRLGLCVIPKPLSGHYRTASGPGDAYLVIATDARQRATTIMRVPPSPLTTRSSPAPHSFPAFYACYLLKSHQIPVSKGIYIGSTPSPPRRIRQHNGELVQGASKTVKGRPWVMQMIVHGFPSKIGALRFEWCWQNPHRSLFLRDSAGEKLFPTNTTILKKSIEVVQTMLRLPPFNLWPLHAILFTEEARDAWRSNLDKKSIVKGRGKFVPPPIPHHAYFPLGFTCITELEGVDGRSGHPSGSGRIDALSVGDERFTSSILAKNTALMASGTGTSCAVCKETASHHAKDALSTALCPHDDCIAVSHMLCLSNRFLAAEASSLGDSFTSSPLIPRGGECPSCHKYTLWGDIVRGSYRRVAGSAVVLPDEDDEEAALAGEEGEDESTIVGEKEEDEADEVITDSDPEKDLFTSGSEHGKTDMDATPKPGTKGKHRVIKEPTVTGKKAGAKSRKKNDISSSSGESSGTDVRASPSTVSRTKRTPKAPKPKKPDSDSDSNIESDFDLASTSTLPAISKRPRGRPRKNATLADSRRGISSISAHATPRPNMLFDVDDSDSDGEEYDPSIFSTLGPHLPITPKKGSVPEIWEISSDDEGEREVHTAHLVSSFDALSMATPPSSSTPIVVDSDLDIVVLLDGGSALPATISPGRRRRHF